MAVDADDITQISEKMGFGSAWCHPQKNDKRMELDKTLAVPEVNGKEPILIDRAEQLLQIAKAIASGDSDVASAYYKLTCDIKLSGKKWLPIGISDSTPFCGIFDGNGYSIKGFKIKAKGLAAAGFFGYIKGGNITAHGGCWAAGIGEGDSVKDATSGMFTGDNVYEIIIGGTEKRDLTVTAYGGYCSSGIGTTDEITNNSQNHSRLALRSIVVRSTPRRARANLLIIKML